MPSESLLIDNWVVFTVAIMIAAQDPKLLQVLPPFLVAMALCLLPWKTAGGKVAKRTNGLASLLATVPANNMPPTQGLPIFGARPLAPRVLPNVGTTAALPSGASMPTAATPAGHASPSWHAAVS